MFNFLDKEMTLKERSTSFSYLMLMFGIMIFATIGLLFTTFKALTPFLCIVDTYIFFGVVKANRLGLMQERKENKKSSFSNIWQKL